MKSINESNQPINLDAVLNIRKSEFESMIKGKKIHCIKFYNLKGYECEIWNYENESDRDKDFESMVY